MPLIFSFNKINKTASRLIKNLKTGKGFTLVELLTVISVTAILFTFTTVSFVNAQQKGRDGKRKADLKSIKQALILFFNDNGIYPPLNPDYMTEASYASNGPDNPWIVDLNSTYIKELPKDPRQANSLNILFAKNILPKIGITPVYAGGGGGGPPPPPTPENAFLYYYWVSADRSAFTLWASLENNNDAELATNPDAYCRQTPPTSYDYCLTQD